MVEARAGAAPRALGHRAPVRDQRPAWSPDGTSIVYEAGGDPEGHVVRGEPCGGDRSSAAARRAPLTAALDRNIARPRFSPDGRFVYFLLEDGGNRHLARVPAAAGTVERVVAGERDITAFIALLEGRRRPPGQRAAASRRRSSRSGAAGALRRVSTVNDAFLKGIRLAGVERFKARSADGTMIDGFLTRPPGAP